MISLAHSNHTKPTRGDNNADIEPSTDTVQRIPLGTFVEREGENGSNYRGTISKFESG